MGQCLCKGRFEEAKETSQKKKSIQKVSSRKRCRAAILGVETFCCIEIPHNQDGSTEEDSLGDLTDPTSGLPAIGSHGYNYNYHNNNCGECHASSGELKKASKDNYYYNKNYNTSKWRNDEDYDDEDMICYSDSYNTFLCLSPFWFLVTLVLLVAGAISLGILTGILEFRCR